MRVTLNRFPEGKKKALTLSYDDGTVEDRRLVDVLNRYGLRATFHLNSGVLGQPGYLTKEEVPDLFAGHEISAHSVTHPFLPFVPIEQAAQEMLNDRIALERLAGYPVRGMSYPFGAKDASIVALLGSLGFEYGRTVESHGSFRMPDNPLLWSPTCHHHEMMQYGEKWIADDMKYGNLHLLYVWGHSFEFERENNWELMDRFGQLVGGRDDIWYATNIEIHLYADAMNRLRFSATGELVHNPSALSVWIAVDGESVEIPGGATVRLSDRGR